MLYKIFTEWRIGARGRELISTGLVLGAVSHERALEMATRRGTCAGLGYQRSYVGLVAIEVAS